MSLAQWLHAFGVNELLENICENGIRRSLSCFIREQLCNSAYITGLLYEELQIAVVTLVRELR